MPQLRLTGIGKKYDLIEEDEDEPKGDKDNEPLTANVPLVDPATGKATYDHPVKKGKKDKKKHKKKEKKKKKHKKKKDKKKKKKKKKSSSDSESSDSDSDEEDKQVSSIEKANRILEELDAQ